MNDKLLFRYPLKSDKNRIEVLHELVHARNFYVYPNDQGDAPITAIADEGSAYLLESVFLAALHFRELEQILMGSPQAGSSIESPWRKGWSATARDTASYEIPFHQAENFNITQTDADHIRDTFGIHVSCAELSRYFNRLAEQSGIDVCYSCETRKMGRDIVPAPGLPYYLR